MLDIYYEPSDLDGDGVAEIWSSNMYSKIAKIMRNQNIDEQHQQSPYVFTFVRAVLKYFEEHGLTKQELQGKARYIFRGISENIIRDQTIRDTCFMATSIKRHVACSFAGKQECGITLQLKTSILPFSHKYAFIDNSINPVFNEDEILLLPGSIKVINFDKKEAVYEVDVDLIREYLNKPLPVLEEMFGGQPKVKKNYRERMLGKIFVLYRAIENRHVEVLLSTRLPTEMEALCKYERSVIFPLIARYEDMTDFIPEVRDLQAYIRDPANKKKRGYLKRCARFFSFSPCTALYDHETKEVSRIGAVPDVIHDECKDKTNDQSVQEAIRNYFEGNAYALQRVIK